MIKLNLSPLLKKLRDEIVSRTRSGYDANNNTFKPYKSKKKRSQKVDLSLTGQMLNSLVSSEDSIYMSNDLATMKASSLERNGRLFLGISPSQNTTIDNYLSDLIEKLLKKELNTWNTKGI